MTTGKVRLALHDLPEPPPVPPEQEKAVAAADAANARAYDRMEMVTAGLVALAASIDASPPGAVPLVVVSDESSIVHHIDHALEVARRGAEP